MTTTPTPRLNTCPLCGETLNEDESGGYNLPDHLVGDCSETPVDVDLGAHSP